MSLLKQIDDKGAVLEWSPVAKFPNIVALGTKVISFELKLFFLRCSKYLGVCNLNSRILREWDLMTLAVN